MKSGVCHRQRHAFGQLVAITRLMGNSHGHQGHNMYRSARKSVLFGASAIAIVSSSQLGFTQDQSVPPATSPAPGGPPSSGTPPTPPSGQQATPPAQTGPATTIPQITVTAPKPAAAPAARTAARPAAAAPAGRPAPAAPTQPTAQQTAATAAAQYNQQIQTFDQQRAAINPPTGTSTDTKTQQDIENLPQGSNVNVSDLVLQFPGITQDFDLVR